MYPEPLSDFDLQLAMGECLSHVRYLLAHNRLIKKPDGQGVIRYTTLVTHPSATETEPSVTPDPSIIDATGKMPK
jgi:hypothetical protein